LFAIFALPQTSPSEPTTVDIGTSMSYARYGPFYDPTMGQPVFRNRFEIVNLM